MPTILVVEDDPSIRALLVMVLSENYTVLEAPGGQEGLRLFAQHHVDLIITDLSMPQFDGFELIRTVRATGRQVKIIAHSALIAQAHVRSLALTAGADLCLAKPVDLTTLEKTVADLLAA